MANNRITHLFLKKMSGLANDEELQDLADFLILHPDEQYFQAILANWWLSQNPSTELETEKDAHFEAIIKGADDDKLNYKIAPVVKIRKIYVWQRVAIAAIVIGIIAFGSWKYFTNDNLHENKASQENEIIAKRGSKSKILLPDGTQVWLNSDSKLTYNNNFNGAFREVTLEGEAFFDVVKNPKRPFIVHTSDINIKVLGTAFDVKSYPLESTIEATLIRGLIEVEKTNQPLSPKIILHPNEKMVYNKIPIRTSLGNSNIISNSTNSNAQSISISNLPKNTMDSARMETSWIYGRLLFEGNSFKELAPKMERWFNVKITFKNNRVANYRFSGAFENENIEEALEALQLTANFKFSLSGNEVIIDKK
ncbi:MAG: FecR family protein [Bacteroidetes bacterium]|nr:FecR family protein [Bacteroidota bacterium]